MVFWEWMVLGRFIRLTSLDVGSKSHAATYEFKKNELSTRSRVGLFVIRIYIPILYNCKHKKE